MMRLEREMPLSMKSESATSKRMAQQFAWESWLNSKTPSRRVGGPWVCYARSRLIDLLRVWRSHTKKMAPRALAYSLCRKFMHCSVDEIPNPEVDTKSKAMEQQEEKKAEAERALARLQKKISDIDDSVKL